MNSGDKKQLKKFLSFAIIAILLFLSFKLIQPFILVLMASFILAYLVHPFSKKLEPKLGKTFSALLAIFLIILILLVPLSFFVGGIINQAYASLNHGGVDSIIERISELELIEKFNIDLDSWVQRGTLLLVSLLGTALSHLPSIIISVIILIFGIYYILTNWEVLSKSLIKYIPFKNKEEIVSEIKRTTNGIVFGSFLMALIQFAISGVGFYLSGVHFYLLLPSLIFVLAFIPGLGSTIVWVPLCIYYFATGNIFTGVGVLITGLILSLFVDIILRARILGSKAKINPFIMLLGILGGISVFGIFGIIVGPLILFYSIKLLQELA